MIIKLIVKICKLSRTDIPDTVYTNVIITLQWHMSKQINDRNLLFNWTYHRFNGAIYVSYSINTV